MARFTPTDVLSSYASVAALNSNFDDIAALMERVVFRDGVPSNSMLANLDLNHFRIQNVGAGSEGTDAVNVDQVTDMVETYAGSFPPVSERIGKYLAFDAEGQMVPSSGTGADAGLRTDLTNSTALALVGTPFGKTLESLLGNMATGRSRGTKLFTNDRLNAVAMAIEISDPATSPIYGFARLADINGGFGKTEVQHYDPDGDGTETDITVPFVRFVTNDSDDSTVEGSLRWACGQIATNGGGYIVYHPRGRITTTLTETLYLPNNCTICAPGRNATIRGSLNGSMLRFYGEGGTARTNIIVWGLRLKIEGGGATVNYDTRPGEIDTFAAVPSFGSNKIALYECSVTGSTDAFFDIAGGASIATPVYFSVINCVVRNVDKVMAISAGTGGALGDTPYVFVTVGGCHFEGCAERKPLASSQSFVHWVGNVDDGVPHYRDYTEGTSVSSVGAGSTRNGAQLRYESNIVRFGTTTAGMGGTTHQGVANVTLTPGAALLIDNYFEEGIEGTVSFNEASVIDLPVGYEYPAVDVLTDTDAAAAAIIAAAGSERLSGPDGRYVPINITTGDSLGLQVNGDAIRYFDDHFWIRQTEESIVDMPVPDIVVSSYTPTLTSVQNITGLSVSRAHYQKVGNRVTVSIQITGTLTTTATRTQIGISLPVLYDFVAAAEITGACRAVASTNHAAGYVTGDVANDYALAILIPTTASGATATIQAEFTYLINT